MTPLRGRILHVDDREENRYVVRRILQRFGYEVAEASTGLSGLERSAELPDLIILDIKLPDIMGFEIAKRIKSNPQTAGIPILFLSATFTSGETKIHALEGGGDAYLTWPVEPPVLLSSVQSLLRIKEGEVLSRLSAKQWETTFGVLTDGLALLSEEGVVLRCNRALAGMLTTSLGELRGADLFSRLRQVFGVDAHLGASSSSFEAHLDGRYYVATSTPIAGEDDSFRGYTFTLSDITERRKSEEVLRNSEKLAATGRLAHTIAHEINNPLAALTNLLYLARSEFESGLPVGQYLELAQQEVNRISRITRQTLSLHRESASPIQVDVSGILRDVVELLRPKADEAHVSVELETRDNAGIQGYPGELRQAFLNFVVNAVEAAPAGGRVLVRSHRSAAWSNGSLPGVRITISDDGAGIPDEVKGQIFEAFFTTKDLKGSGLGLWLSNSIIVKHHGSVRFRTRTTPPSTGTCFNIFLPRS